MVAIDDDDGTGRVRPIPWGRFKALVLEAWDEGTCSASHARMFRSVIAALEALDLAGEGEPRRAIAGTADLTVGTVRRFAAAQPAGISPYTLKGRLAVLRCICGLAFELRALAVSPFALRPMKRWVRTGKPAGKRALTRDECRRLLKVLESDCATRKGWALWKAWRLKVAVSVAIYCGLRRNELLRLQVGDVDLPGRLIHVRPHGKTLKTAGSEDSVPIPEAIVPALEEWLSSWRLAGPEGYPVPADCPWLIPTVARRHPWVSGCPESRALECLKRAAARAGIPHVHFQMLRRTTASLLEAKGVPPILIARILRHSMQVDERFYRVRDEDALKSAAKDLGLD